MDFQPPCRTRKKFKFQLAHQPIKIDLLAQGIYLLALWVSLYLITLIFLSLNRWNLPEGQVVREKSFCPSIKSTCPQQPDGRCLEPCLGNKKQMMQKGKYHIFKIATVPAMWALRSLFCEPSLEQNQILKKNTVKMKIEQFV